MNEESNRKALNDEAKHEECYVGPTDISDEDILKAMKEMEGYLDITPGDFKEIYRHAYEHALNRLLRALPAKEVMSKGVVAVDMDTPLKDVAEAMARRGISGVPVLDQNRAVVGSHLGEGFPKRFWPGRGQIIHGSPGYLSWQAQGASQ